MDPKTKKAEFYVLQNALIVKQFRNKNTVVLSYQRTFVNLCIQIRNSKLNRILIVKHERIEKPKFNMSDDVRDDTILNFALFAR